MFVKRNAPKAGDGVPSLGGWEAGRITAGVGPLGDVGKDLGVGVLEASSITPSTKGVVERWKHVPRRDGQGRQYSCRRRGGARSPKSGRQPREAQTAMYRPDGTTSPR